MHIVWHMSQLLSSEPQTDANLTPPIIILISLFLGLYTDFCSIHHFLDVLLNENCFISICVLMFYTCFRWVYINSAFRASMSLIMSMFFKHKSGSKIIPNTIVKSCVAQKHNSVFDGLLCCLSFLCVRWLKGSAIFNNVVSYFPWGLHFMYEIVVFWQLIFLRTLHPMINNIYTWRDNSKVQV